MVARGKGGRKDELAEYRGFLVKVFSSKSIPYDIIMGDTSHYTCVQTHRMYNSTREPYLVLGDFDV